MDYLPRVPDEAAVPIAAHGFASTRRSGSPRRTAACSGSSGSSTRRTSTHRSSRSSTSSRAEQNRGVGSALLDKAKELRPDELLPLGLPEEPGARASTSARLRAREAHGRLRQHGARARRALPLERQRLSGARRRLVLLHSSTGSPVRPRNASRQQRLDSRFSTRASSVSGIVAARREVSDTCARAGPGPRRDSGGNSGNELPERRASSLAAAPSGSGTAPVRSRRLPSPLRDRGRCRSSTARRGRAKNVARHVQVARRRARRSVGERVEEASTPERDVSPRHACRVELVVRLRQLGRLLGEEEGRIAVSIYPEASARCWRPRIERAMTRRWISLVPS